MYTFQKKYENKNLEELWAIISIDLRENNIKEVSSIRGKIYKIEDVTNVGVHYSAESRNGGKIEDLTKTDFINFLMIIKDQTIFNTNTIKMDLPKEIYAKRSPLFAILLALEIIVVRK